MKRITITIILLCCLFELYGQEKNRSSVEIQGNTSFFFVRDNNFNYGYSLILSRYINKIKVSAGVNYATKNTYTKHVPSYWLDSVYQLNYNIKYLHFPLLITFNAYTFNQFKLNTTAGIVFNRIVDYDIVEKRNNKPDEIEKDIYNGQNLGFSFRFGIGLTKSILQNFNISLSTFADYKYRLDFMSMPYNYRNLTEDRVSCGATIGVEYKF